jgi:2-oxoglutarate ferredoxin oxidoreductase subunit gamma
MADRTEIRLAGAGGQGIILAGIILADAAVRDGKEVTQTQSYGPEARGGASRAEVIIADSEISYPHVVRADVLLCMSQEAYDHYAGKVREGGLLILDANHVTNALAPRVVRAPISELARQATGKNLTANVAALGLLVGLTDVVSRPSLEAAVRARTPAGTAEMNLLALTAGLEAAAGFKEKPARPRRRSRRQFTEEITDIDSP